MNESVKIFPKISIIFRVKSTLLPEVYRIVEHQHLALACLPDLTSGHSPLGHQALAIPAIFQFFRHAVSYCRSCTYVVPSSQKPLSPDSLQT